MSEDTPMLIGAAPRMRRVLDLIAASAACDATVLITGESGAGKETVARAIHAASAARWPGPFCALHCAALPEALIEGELFGHVKGVFAPPHVVFKPGFFEKARGGTLFLKAVEDLPLPVQALLLRAIQERRITRVGEAAEVDIHVRIIASTYSDLAERVREGQFRADLFSQLSVVRIDVPPLRERPEDIPLLAVHFLNRFARRQDGKPTEVTQEAMQALSRYTWPGNVRELEYVVERACILAQPGEIRPEHLPSNLTET
jgi:two-component system, NtrC family, response regulator AtoC